MDAYGPSLANAFMYLDAIIIPIFQSARSAGVGSPLSASYSCRIFGTAASSSSAPVGLKRRTSATSLVRSACRRNPGLPLSMWNVPSGSYLTVSSDSPNSSSTAASGFKAFGVVSPAKNDGPVSKLNSPTLVLRWKPCVAPPGA